MDKLAFKMGRLDVRPGLGGTVITVRFITNLGTTSYVDITASEDGINVSATGTLNQAGQEALKDGMILANLIKKYHYEKTN